MSTISVVIQSNKHASTYKLAGQKNKNTIKLIALLKGLVSGSILGTVDIYASSADPVNASATATLATVVADNTITLHRPLVLAGVVTPLTLIISPVDRP